MGKYFGTDGFRGEAGITLTADHAYKVGRFLGWYYNALRERNGNNEPARIVIGKDTRRSSYMFEYSLVAGLTASGADAYLLHVTTTPSVAYIARVDDFDCGIMISASHNPYYDNGIKLIDCYGEKMPEETLLLVEDYLDGKLHVFDKDWPELPFARREHIGCTVDYVSGRNRYMGYLISLGIYSFKGIKVGLDCANGSSWTIAKSVFDTLGADTYVINNEPNGLNINNNTILKRTYHRDGTADTDMYFDADGNPMALSKGQYGIKHSGKVNLLLDKNGKVKICVDNILNGFPAMVVVSGVIICILMLLLPEKVSTALTIAYVVFILYETLMFRETGDARTNFVLFSYADRFFTEQSVRVGVINNIWLFIPLGTGVHRNIRKKWVLLIPLLLSIAIETTQYITGLGIAEFDDVFGNTLGGWIGIVIAYMVMKWKFVKHNHG